MKRCIWSLFGASIFLMLWVYPVSAQNDNSSSNTYTLIFKGEPLSHALQQLVEKTGMSLIYDPAIMTNYRVYKIARSIPAEQILRLILKGSGLDFIQLSSGTYVLTTAPKKQLQFGNLAGQITDRATGGPLANVNITLPNASGGATTNSAGYFSIPQLAEGRHEIILTYVGYNPVRDTVWIPANQTARLDFSMVAKPVFIKPLVISGIQKHLPAATAFTQHFIPSELKSSGSPGGTDVIKKVGAISGITLNLPLADLNIQGGKASAHQLLLDGVPVYNPVSMGRLLGAFSPFAIDKITIKKAGFGAKAGSRLSGLINFQQEIATGANNTFLIEANPLNVNARFDHSFSFKKGPEINFMIAGRSNIWRWYKKPALKNTLRNWDRIDPLISNHLMQIDSTYTYFSPRNHRYDISYYDLHFAARIKHDPFRQSYISAYRGKNSLETSLYSENVAPAFETSTPDLFYSIDGYNWTNTMAKIEHQWLINARFNANISGYISHHTMNHEYIITNNIQQNLADSPVQLVGRVLSARAQNAIETGSSNAVAESNLQLNLKYSASKNYHLKGGLGVTYLDYRFHLSDQYYQASQANSTSFKVAGYVQNNFFLSDQTSLTIGSRISYIPSRDLVLAEPRFAVKQDWPGTSVGYLSAKLSGGVYRQFINQFDVTNIGPSTLVPSIRFWAPVDYTTTVPKAYHIAGDLLWEPALNWKFRIETYYKWIPSRLVLDYKDLSDLSSNEFHATNKRQHQFITTATGYAYGLGLSTEKTIPSLNIHLKGKYEYSISRQRIPSRFGGAYQPVPWSQPHHLSALAYWNFHHFTFLLQWQGIWGRSWGFRKAYYDYLSVRDDMPESPYRFNDPGNDKLSAYALLNASISYQHSINNAGLSIRLDLFNLLDHKNVLNWWLLPYKTESGSISYHKRERTMPGFRPSISIKFTY